MDRRTSQTEAELINAGFRPTRLAFPVRLVRRLLWPFIRPFHFHNMRQAEQVSHRVEQVSHRVEQVSHRVEQMSQQVEQTRAEMDRLAAVDFDSARIDSVEAGLNELRSRFADWERITARTEDVQRILLMHARLRSELLAVVNRHVPLEAARDAHRRMLDSLIAGEHAVGRRLSAAEGGVANAHERLDLVIADVHAAVARMTDLDARLANGLFLASAGDATFLLKSGDFISEVVRRAGEWDAHVIRVAALAAATVGTRTGNHTGGRALDVGAHFGLMTIPFARLFDEVISFEPNVFNAALLRANVLLNGLTATVQVRREALGASVGCASLAPAEWQEIPLPLDEHGRFAPRMSSNLGAYSFVNDGTGLSEAPATTIDALGLDDVAFIKVDVQGADGAVLLGGTETITRCRPWLIFEWEETLSQPFGVTFDEVAAKLRSAGYALHVLHRHNQKQVDHVAVPSEEEPALLVCGEAV